MLLLPHNLYSGAKHIPLSSQRPFHFNCYYWLHFNSNKTNTIQLQEQKNKLYKHFWVTELADSQISVTSLMNAPFTISRTTRMKAPNTRLPRWQWPTCCCGPASGPRTPWWSSPPASGPSQASPPSSHSSRPSLQSWHLVSTPLFTPSAIPSEFQQNLGSILCWDLIPRCSITRNV